MNNPPSGSQSAAEIPHERPTAGSDTADRMVQQMMELWVGPEIRNRADAGSLPDNFELRAAQVLMDVGPTGTVVRLNEEVRAVARLRVPTVAEFQIGAPVRASDIEEVMQIELTEEDPDSAHMTMILGAYGWHIAFDFRYNATTASAHLDLAAEYLATAQDALASDRPRPAAETLFAACELAAKALLLGIPDERYLQARTHGTVGSDFNLFAKQEWWDPSFARALNRLRELRPSHRYLQGDRAPRDGELAELSETVATMIREARLRTPVRHSVQIPGFVRTDSPLGGPPD